MKVQISGLEDLAHRALGYYGYDEEESRAILEILMYAQMAGNNQGLIKLIGKGIPKDERAQATEVVKETRLSALIDGHRQMGMLVLKEAVKMALDKAREHGFAIVGTTNTFTSTGAIGYYAREIAKEGFLGFVFAGTPSKVCAHGSYEPIFGTNPLAIGVPSDNEPIVLDMATAAMSNYGLIEANVAGRSISDDVAYDREGNPTTSAAKALEGATRPFDRSYKGAGLAMMVEVLTGPLVAASVGDSYKDRGRGNLVYVMDPELLVDKEIFSHQISQLAERVRNTKRLPGVDEVLVPGEIESRSLQERLRSGEIEIEENLYRELEKMAKAVP
jgi:LDH2 family malate/lactate/ureidoglycolate dehydrogenase